MAANFCYWDAKSKADTIVIIVNQTVVTALLSVALLRMPNLYRLYRSHFQINVAKIALIHAIVIAWGISSHTIIQFNPPLTTTRSWCSSTCRRRWTARACRLTRSCTRC
jgi:hypothetical protein